MTHLTVITGPMFSGKSEELIRRLRRAAYAHQKILLLKPQLDNRSTRDIFKFIKDDGKLSKYERLTAKTISSAEDWGKIRPRDFDIIAIDEAQFFDKWLITTISDTLDKIAHLDITIIVSGLDMDAWRKPFGVMPELMSMADHVLKFAAICLHCEGKYGPGIFTQKKTSSTQQVEVGDEEIYEARCRACHILPN